MEKAARHLATRPRSEKELYEYLIKKGFLKEEIDEAISILKENKYLDDKAYAATYFRYALGKRKSVFKIKYELRNKGVSGEDIDQGIFIFEDENEVDINTLERQNAEAEAKKCFESNLKCNAKSKSVSGSEVGAYDLHDIEESDELWQIKKKALDKTARRLAGLGYPSSMISSILEGLRG